MNGRAWRILASIMVMVGLSLFQDAGSGQSVAASRPSKAACAQLKGRVERQLAAAQRCQADDECVSISFEYAFRPCGESVRGDAALEEVAARAKEYVDRCRPVLRPVKCAHKTVPVCARRRCTLTAPPTDE